MSQIPASTKQNKHVLWDNPKDKQKVATAHKITKVIFTIRIPLFNATFWTQKKLLGKMQFSARLKTANFRRFYKKFPVLAKQAIGFDKTTWCSRNFKGDFSDYVPRNLFFFLWNFENVRWNFENVRRNWRKMPKVWNERAEKDKTEKEEVCFDFLERRKNLRFLPFGINISPSWFNLV